MLSIRLIMVATIALLTAADVVTVSAGPRRSRASKPRRHQFVCPECPRYQLKEPCELFPDPNPDMSTPDQPAPPPLTDSEKPDQQDQSQQDRPEQPQQPSQQQSQQQPQRPQTATPTFTPTTAATSPQSTTPNMIGDLFNGSDGVSSIVIQPDDMTVSGTPQVVNFQSGYFIRDFHMIPNGTPGDAPITRFVNGSPGQAQFGIAVVAGVPISPQIQFTSTSLVEGSPISAGTPISLNGDPLVAPGAPQAGTYFTIDQGGVNELGAPDPADAAQYQAVVTTDLQTTQPGLDQQKQDYINNNGPGTFDDQGPGSVILGPGYAIVNVEDGDGVVSSGDTFYVQQVEQYVPDSSIFTPQQTITPDAIIIPIVNPASAPGAAIGRQKIGENTSPLPRSRVFFNYSYFDNTTLAPGGVNVNRFTPGFEWAFLDNDLSVEVRTPFASTLDSTMRLGGLMNTDEVEFGNIVFNLKALLYRDRNYAIAAGLGLTLPTAEDVNVFAADGTRLIRIDNDAVHLMPFVGGLWTPNERLFVQSFLQFDFDTNGNQVYLTSFDNGMATGILQDVGAANDASLAYLDLSIGYWIYQNFNRGATISAIAPMAEIHYNASMTNSDIIRSSSGGATYQIGTNEDLDLVNVVIGLTTVIRDSSTFTLGYTTPLCGSDQQFDGELRAMFNLFFGGSRANAAFGNRRFVSF